MSCAAKARRDPTRLREVPPPEYVAADPGWSEPESLALRPCARCGTLFPPVDRQHPGRYCSVACRVLAQSEEFRNA
jgi:hypothetical protein